MTDDKSDLTQKNQADDLARLSNELAQHGDYGHVEGDVIVTGDISGGYVAIGRGAQVIVQQVMSAAEEAEQQHQLETQILAQAVADYVGRFKAQLPGGDAVAQTEPYKSLLPYRLEDAPLFFGRDQAKTDLLAGASRGRLMVLHAESGAGKTSLLQAGLAANLLAQGQLPLYVRAWRHSPSLAIKQTLVPDLSRVPQLAELPLRAFLYRVTALLGSNTRVYILLDQFEEFFIRVGDEVREQFIEELGQCVDDEALRTRFVLSLRRDHFAGLSDFRSRIPYVFTNEYPLKLFSRAEAASAITAPAALVGLAYGPGVTDQILNDLLQASDQRVIMPAQLQLVCWALYRELTGEQRLITLDQFQHMGGVAGILRNYLRRVMTREISAKQRQTAQRLIEALVRSDRTRDILTVAQLARTVGPTEQIQPVLDALIASRLLRVIEAGPNEEVAYELAHDYLIEQIELDPEVLARKAAQELLDQEVEAWLQTPDLRLGEEKLKIIRAQEQRLVFTSDAQTLYDLSKKAQRRRRGILFGLFGGVVLVACVAIFLFQSLSIAQDALVEATAVIRTARDEAVVAENRQATAQLLANLAQAAEREAVAAQATAVVAGSTASAARQQAEAGQATAVLAEQTAAAARQIAETQQAIAQQSEVDAIFAQQTAQAGEAAARDAEAQAVQAQQTARAGQATAQAGQEAAQASQATAQASQATAQARQSAAEAAAQAAETAAEAARQAQAAAEAAQREADEARREAEREAERARRNQEQAEAAARDAQATRVAVETLRATAEAALARTQQLATIIGNTQNCAVDIPGAAPLPGGLTYDGASIWVFNRGTSKLVQLNAGDCSIVASYPTGAGPSDVIVGGGFIWVAEGPGNAVQRVDPTTGITVTFTAGPPGSEPTALVYDDSTLWVASTSFGGSQNKISRLDPTSGAILASYDTVRIPRDLVFDGSHIWIANSEAGTVFKMDRTTGARTSYNVGSEPVWLAFDGQFIWVANKFSNSITKIRVSDGTAVTFATGGWPDALAFDGRNIWSANQLDHTITKLDAVTGEILIEIPTADSPTALSFDGANMWVVSDDDNILQKIPVNMHPVGKEPEALLYHQDHLWVANGGDNTISKLPLLGSNALPQTFAVGAEPVALAGAGANIWVANSKDDTVTKLLGQTGQTLGTFPSGAVRPSGLAFDGSHIWAISTDSNSVSRIREADGALTGTFSAGIAPIDILANGSQIWIATRGRSLLAFDAQGAIVTTYNLSEEPRSFVLDSISNSFWVGTYSLSNPIIETRLLQVRVADGTVQSNTRIPSSSPDDLPQVTFDGSYVWLVTAGTFETGTVYRSSSTAPTNLTSYSICKDPTDLINSPYGVWVGCRTDGVVQQISVDGSQSRQSGLRGIDPGAVVTRLYLPVIHRK